MSWTLPGGLEVGLLDLAAGVLGVALLWMLGSSLATLRLARAPLEVTWLHDAGSVRGSSGTVWQVRVEGTLHTAAGPVPARSRREVSVDEVRRWRPGETRWVRYDPEHPNEFVVPASSANNLVFILILTMMFLGFLLMAVGSHVF